MKLFEKLFCKHHWKTHTKERYEWTEKKIVPETRYWMNPDWDVQSYSSVTEVLVCKKCGKIKQIEY